MSALFHQNPEVETSPIRDELILFNPRNEKFCILNRTSKSIWMLLKVPSSAEQITEEIERTFVAVNVAGVRRDVDVVLQEMLTLGLVVSENGKPAS
jgi:hypothetical protein